MREEETHFRYLTEKEWRQFKVTESIRPKDVYGEMLDGPKNGRDAKKLITDNDVGKVADSVLLEIKDPR